MLLRTLLVALALLTPTVAQTPQSTLITIRACISQGTHGSLANLSDTEVIAAGHAALDRPTRYWFDQNLAGFAERIGQRVEIAAAPTAVIDEPRELQATDGVFADVDARARNAQPSAVGAAGTSGPADAPVGTSGAGEAVPDHPVIVKATVSGLRLIGSCR